MDVFRVIFLIGIIWIGLEQVSLGEDNISPLIGTNDDNFLVENVLFQSNGNKNLNIKFWVLHFEYKFLVILVER